MKKPGKKVAALLCAFLLAVGPVRAAGLPPLEKAVGLLRVDIFREEEKRYDPAEVRQGALRCPTGWKEGPLPGKGGSPGLPIPIHLDAQGLGQSGVVRYF